MPETSIVTPTYNRAHLLVGLVENVLEQSYRDYELIIVDDGSSDNTREILDPLLDKYTDKLKYVYQANLGSASARNNGVKHANGQYIAFLDSDDMWDKEYLQTTIEHLKSNQYDWTVTWANKIDIDENGVQLNETIIKPNIQRSADYFNRELSLFEGLLTGNVVGETSRVTVTKKAFHAAGGFSDHLKLSQDYELWLRLAKNECRLCIIDQPLVIYKKSIDSVTKIRFNEALRNGYKIISQYCKEAIKRDPKFRQFYADKLWIYARDSVKKSKKKDYKLFVKCVLKSLMFKFNLI